MSTPEPDGLAVADLMACALAREIRERDVLGVGLGTPLAVLAGLLARRVHARSAHLLVGGAVDPDADFGTVLGGPAAMAGCTPGYVPHLDTMGMAESQAMTVQVLRPAQVDGRGDLNTSRIGPPGRPTRRFPGGLATADVPGLLCRVLIYHPDHSPRALPERVDCVTGRGAAADWDGEYRSAGVTTLVTDLAVIGFAGGAATLVSAHPWSSPEDVLARTGFTLTVPADLRPTPAPSPAEQQSLAVLDPGGRRCEEIRRSHPARKG